MLGAGRDMLSFGSQHLVSLDDSFPVQRTHEMPAAPAILFHYCHEYPQPLIPSRNTLKLLSAHHLLAARRPPDYYQSLRQRPLLKQLR